MDKDEMLRALLTDAAERGIRYRETCGDRPVAPTADAVAAVPALVEPFPEQGCPDDEVLALANELHLDPNAVAAKIAARRHLSAGEHT